jgi:hypothetical protein
MSEEIGRVISDGQRVIESLARESLAILTWLQKGAE